jgi:hypothetical protein
MTLARASAVAAALLIVTGHTTAAGETPVAEVSQLRLYSSFWQNLHHFLYVSAWATRPVVPRAPRLAMRPAAGPVVSMTADEKTAWDAAVGFYDRELASKDLLFDSGMTTIKLALADADASLSDVPLDGELRAVLLSAAPIYRKYWWNEHDAANRAWIDNAVRRTAQVAAPIIARLTALYGTPWFGAPVRVDVVRVGKSQGAYTSVQPRAHIVVASADTDYDGWASTEMLFHESSHALIRPVQIAVDSAARAAHKNSRDLWHVVLFYTAGEVTRQQLARNGVDYSPYLYATGLFDRAWPAFRGPIEANVRPFIDGQKTLAQMSADLAAALP